MHDVESQLRRYADAVEACHGPGRPASPPVVALTPPGPSRRLRGRELSLIAAGLAVVVGLGAVAAVRPDQSSVATDDATAAAEVSEDAIQSEVSGPPRLLPSSDEWVVVGADEHAVTDRPASESDLRVFEHDGRAVILLTKPGDTGLGSLEQAEVETSYNRAYVVWEDGGVHFDLMGFDVAAEPLRALAQSLVETPDGWDLPGAELILFEPAGESPLGTAVQLELAPRSATGEIDLSSTITQHAGPARPGSLYRTLHEASSQGPVEATEIAGAPGFAITGGGSSYALTYTGGYLVTWGDGTPVPDSVDLPGLLTSLEPVASATWTATLSGAPAAYDTAIDAAMSELDPIPAGELPYFTLPEPWRLQRTLDESLLPEPVRRRVRAEAEANRGQIVSRGVWAQGFTSLDQTGDAVVAEVVVLVSEAIGRPPILSTFGESSEPVSLPGLEALASTDGRGCAWVAAMSDTHQIEVVSCRLARGELIEFVESLSLRSPSGADGFDPPAQGWELGLDTPSAIDELAPIPGWSATWASGGQEARVIVSEVPVEQFELEVAQRVHWVGAEVSRVPGEPFLVVVGEQGREEVTWYDDGLGVSITVADGPGGEGLIDLARSLEQISTGEWTELATPFVVVPGSGN